jgi:hypothetical protein
MAGTGHTTAAPVSAKATAPAPAARATAGTASAGTSPGAMPAGTATLTGTAASALATKAFANTEASASVRVTGESVSTGGGSQAVSFDLTLVKEKGCQGTIALSKTETFQMAETGGYVWILPNSAFYTSLHLSKAALALIADKYIKVKSSNSEFGDLVKICSFSGLFGSLPKVTGTGYVATPRHVQRPSRLPPDRGEQGGRSAHLQRVHPADAQDLPVRVRRRSRHVHRLQRRQDNHRPVRRRVHRRQPTRRLTAASSASEGSRLRFRALAPRPDFGPLSIS